MGKVIKVDDKVYEQLNELRGKGETFSYVIEIILVARLSLFNMLTVLEGQLRYPEWQAKKLKEFEEQKRKRQDEVSGSIRRDH